MPKNLYINLSFLTLFFISNAGADPVILDNFSSNKQAKWKYVSDQVMGGISEGKLVFDSDKEESYAQLTGRVSTENNGGFIQFRTDLKELDKDNIEGIYVKVKGNNQKYFIHLRTKGTILPWQYYQGDFIAGDNWQIVKLPFRSFVASSKWLSKRIKTKSIKSLGVVAFGREHTANLSVAEIGFY